MSGELNLPYQFVTDQQASMIIQHKFGKEYIVYSNDLFNRLECVLIQGKRVIAYASLQI